jgi:hypothetical protein
MSGIPLAIVGGVSDVIEKLVAAVVRHGSVVQDHIKLIISTANAFSGFLYK